MNETASHNEGKYTVGQFLILIRLLTLLSLKMCSVIANVHAP